MNQNPGNNNRVQTDAEPVPVTRPGIDLDDVYYTFFRHKWLLLAFVGLGVLATAVVTRVQPPQYESAAKVMVRYLLDTQANPSSPDSAPKPLESGGDAVINSEVEILTSLDVAERAAEIVGPERILAKVGGGSNRLAAAGVIRSGIEVTPPRTTVITVRFRHPDQEMVQPVLRALLDMYTEKHREVHLGVGALDQHYSRQRDELREKLTQTEEKLKTLKTQAKVLSVDEAKRAYQVQIDKLTGELQAADTELAVAKAVVGVEVRDTGGTNNPANAAPPAEIVRDYADVVERLETLKKRERELLLVSNFTADHPSVRTVREAIARLKTQKVSLETEHPSLSSLGPVVGAGGTNSQGVGLPKEITNIKGLTARVEKLATLLSNCQAEAISVMDLEPEIAKLERQRQQEEKDYQFYQNNIEQARRGEAGAGKVVNMSIVQRPTPPRLDQKKILKLIGAAFVGCVGFGVGLAFLFDLVLDRTIRRSRDVRRHLRLPLFLSIPETNNRRRSVVARWLRKTEDKNGAADHGEATHANGVAPWDNEHHLRAFADGLRERLITYFEINGITHAPKLVGVTGCSKGSGVTTLASGLAAALSKIGNGNVLLVDMNVGEGEAHAFHSGKPGCALANIQEPESPADGSVQESLYLAASRAGVNDKLAKVMPAGFQNFVTNLKASDYDYIIFDMPSVTPTSATPRLGSYLDMVLFVVESGKTPQQLAGQAGALLTEARANAAVVLNKCRRFVPPVLSHDT